MAGLDLAGDGHSGGDRDGRDDDGGLVEGDRHREDEVLNPLRAIVVPTIGANRTTLVLPPSSRCADEPSDVLRT